MRTTINVQDSVINDILHYYNAKSKTEAVNKALVEWVRYLKKNKLINLRGTIDIEDNLYELKQKEIEDLVKYE